MKFLSLKTVGIAIVIATFASPILIIGGLASAQTVVNKNSYGDGSSVTTGVVNGQPFTATENWFPGGQNFVNGSIVSQTFGGVINRYGKPTDPTGSR